ncbi:acetate--CoA ligase family protein [Thalassococcus lentus]|uniref:Acetate--CoA ligase family protein n=1 Tax=Thalassococcus lentus TaxID=1210524 RepID=A0ABT4XXZ1_9RHOB|nr:acetate--CoA ligase family protein [Thalassococcus lentus]MDA7426802.1 acetate--CoA ligase family protein [Thalassococcus lentus]
MTRFERLLQPRSIAVVGGGAWCRNVIEQCTAFGFDGPIWPVHPKRPTVGGLSAFPSLDDLPEAPDACFIGVNREATVGVVEQLSSRGAGGAVCFASGFREAAGELADGADLQQALLKAAGDMPILGPNCYGFINALDSASLWPDIHGLQPVERGVGILAQSSNVALNLTMQRRGLPIGFLGTVGNQAQVDLAALGMALLDDPRITALGLYVEGFSDIRAFEALANKAHVLGKPIVAMKLGASEQASAAAISHTASLAGSDAGAQAFLDRLGIARARSLGGFLETLKILHCTGPLRSSKAVSMSCSGGEASLIADSALGTDVQFPALTDRQHKGLSKALGPKVALANPLDYHTYIWADEGAMQACYKAMLDRDDLGIGLLVLDFPRPDRCETSDWDVALRAAAGAAGQSKTPLAILSSIPDTMPEARAEQIMEAGMIPLCGIGDSLEAIAAAASVLSAPGGRILMPENPENGVTERVLFEDEAKVALSAHGLPCPIGRAVPVCEAAEAAQEIGFPVALKAMGQAHKTGHGGVWLGLASPSEVTEAAHQIGSETLWLEQMMPGALAELLIGVQRDPAHGFVLTIGAGGVLTEILSDVEHRLLPVSRQDVLEVLDRLRMAPILRGYRGAEAVDTGAIADAVLCVQDYVLTRSGAVQEIEINPLLCFADKAVAVDALIRLEEENE